MDTSQKELSDAYKDGILSVMENSLAFFTGLINEPNFDRKWEKLIQKRIDQLEAEILTLKAS